jgi:hypothetical protein
MTPESTPAQRWLLRALQALAAALGALYGYDIGSRVSGPGMGVVMAANAAVFAALLTSAATEPILRLLARRRSAR